MCWTDLWCRVAASPWTSSPPGSGCTETLQHACHSKPNQCICTFICFCVQQLFHNLRHWQGNLIPNVLMQLRYWQYTHPGHADSKSELNNRLSKLWYQCRWYWYDCQCFLPSYLNGYLYNDELRLSSIVDSRVMYDCFAQFGFWPLQAHPNTDHRSSIIAPSPFSQVSLFKCRTCRLYTFMLPFVPPLFS